MAAYPALFSEQRGLIYCCSRRAKNELERKHITEWQNDLVQRRRRDEMAHEYFPEWVTDRKANRQTETHWLLVTDQLDDLYSRWSDFVTLSVGLFGNSCLFGLMLHLYERDCSSVVRSLHLNSSLGSHVWFLRDKEIKYWVRLSILQVICVNWCVSILPSMSV